MSTNTVLIVEPDDLSRSMLRATLEEDGYNVLEAAEASDALALVKGSEIPLVVTELYLAAGKDRCLLHAIRRSSVLRRTKVLAYTEHGRSADRAWAIAEGADGYVLKKNGQVRLLEVAASLRSKPPRG